MKYLVITILLLPILAWSQNVKDSIIFAPIFNVSFAAQLPGGDLAQRFGYSNSLGFRGGVKTMKNFQFELGGTFFFSQNVKDKSMLDGLLTSDGNIINNEGEYANFLVYERGFTGTISAGKIFPVIGPNQNSGILIKIGVGGMRHKVRIDNQWNKVPQLSKDKLPYYDRKTFGFVTTQYIGYQHLSNNRLTNFNIGFQIYEGFTRGMRDYQVDLMGPYKDQRLDLLMEIRIGWIVPVYKRAPKDFYIN